PNTEVPAPSAVFLFGSGLAGLIGFNRKLRKQG
ncbi:MAG: PEP-CTERM sorting domain-containing protein, partial [Methyloprofundus sp.]|nr:PEP-CTERM sorting domain-containing protein [Methyloprofundus sp.]